MSVRIRPYSQFRRVPVPRVATQTSQTQPIDYKKGLFNGVPNDLQPKNTLRYVTDMRFNGIGKYKTRKGCDHYTVPVGETVNVQVTSTTGAADAGFTTTTWLAEKVTATATGPMTKIDVRVKNSAAATGAVVVYLYSNVSNAPGALLATTTIAETDIGSSYAYETAYSMEAPDVTNGTVYWVVIGLQESGTGTMYVSSTTNSTDAKVSTDAGQSWSAATYSLNVKMYSSTTGGVKGKPFRAYRPDGSAITFFDHGTNVYKVNDADGSITSIDSSISALSTVVRFAYVDDTLFYTDGVGKPRKYDHATASEVTTATNNARNIIEHVGLLWFMNADDNNGGYYSNFEDFEVFTSTDFFNEPAPNTSDPLTAWEKLNGVLYMFTRKNKRQIMGTDTATFESNDAFAQKGTFSQESVVADQNEIFFASDDGVYEFNGTYEKNIFEPIIDEYTSIERKEDIHLELHGNKLYVWYRPNGQAEVSACYVYNTLYKVMESHDLNTKIGGAFARHDITDMFIQASNRAGVLYYAERQSNNYHNLGAPLYAEVRTAYDHFGSPQQKKRITYWRPLLESVQGNYSLQAGFGADYSDDFTFRNVPLQGTGYTYDDAESLYDSATYAAGGASTDMSLNIFGDAYRWQRVYKHHAAYEPVVFAGEVLTVQTRRLR